MMTATCTRRTLNDSASILDGPSWCVACEFVKSTLWSTSSSALKWALCMHLKNDLWIGQIWQKSAPQLQECGFWCRDETSPCVRHLRMVHTLCIGYYVCGDSNVFIAQMRRDCSSALLCVESVGVMGTQLCWLVGDWWPVRVSPAVTVALDAEPRI